MENEPLQKPKKLQVFKQEEVEIQKKHKSKMKKIEKVMCTNINLETKQ